MPAAWVDITLSTGASTIQGRMWSDNGLSSGNMSQGFIPLDASLTPTGIASNPSIIQPVDYFFASVIKVAGWDAFL